MIPSTQGYSVMGPVRQGLLTASCAGARRWMNAVAMITPDPKNFATKNIHGGILLFFDDRGSFRAQTGKTAPSVEPTRITKTAEMRMDRHDVLMWPAQRNAVKVTFGSNTVRFGAYPIRRWRVYHVFGSNFKYRRCDILHGLSPRMIETPEPDQPHHHPLSHNGLCSTKPAMQ